MPSIAVARSGQLSQLIITNAPNTTTTTTTTTTATKSNNQPSTSSMLRGTNDHHHHQHHRPRRTAGRSSLSLGLSLLAAVLAACLATASAFPSGAPDSACKDLKPGHGVEAATGAAPFELTQDKLQVAPGDQIKVTLSSPSKTNFKGLIVQALNEKGEPAKGKFLAGKGLKTLDSCSAVTHADKEAKKTATLVWEASSELKSKEAFTFKATVVAKFDEFYMNIKSTLAARR